MPRLPNVLAEYCQALPALRQQRIKPIIALIRKLYPQATCSLEYKMPTFRIDEKRWMSVGNQKSYLSVYTCSLAHIQSFKDKYPKIKNGTGCINFKDKDDIPLDDLAEVIHHALGD